MAAGPSLAARLPAEIPFYVMHAGGRLPRRWATPEIWKESLYPWPFDPLTGPYARSANDLAKIAIHCGMLRRLDSRWGTFWQGDFTSFDKPGVYQIETEHQFSLPFAIDPAIYDRLVRGYLVYLRAQRSGCDVPGVRPATNTDDAVLDTDGSYVPVAGGWYDAGDLRKWMSLTAFHLEALFRCWHSGPEAFPWEIIVHDENHVDIVGIRFCRNIVQCDSRWAGAFTNRIEPKTLVSSSSFSLPRQA
jgi:hypothetical protein